MLESLFNKIVGLQDCCKIYLLHALLRFISLWLKQLQKINYLSIDYVLLRNVKCKVMLTEPYLEPSQTSTMQLFPLQLSHILKTYLIRSSCL